MAFDNEQIEELKTCYPELSLVEEGGCSFILIANLQLPGGCDPPRVDGLLCPTARDGYPSRLFLSAKVTHKGQGQSWNADGVMIAGRKWWSPSWNTKQSNQRLLGMVTAHLQAYR
jgi:hypothetical protein